MTSLLPPCELAASADSLLSLMNRCSVEERDVELACERFLAVLHTTDDPRCVRAAIDRDAEHLLLPPEVKSAAYERLLVLAGRDPATLRQYAWHLLMYGPDEDDHAGELLEEADRLDCEPPGPAPSWRKDR